MFGSIVLTPEDVRPVGYRWIFVRKRNEKNEITRYKARLVAQGFSQKLLGRIVLIGGQELVGLMIKYKVGIQVKEVLEICEIDEDFFE